MGEKYGSYFDDLRTMIFANCDGLPEKVLSAAGLELWLACHCCFYMGRLMADSTWQPTLSEDEEGAVARHAVAIGLATVLRVHGHGHGREIEVGAEDRFNYFTVLTAHLLGLADKAAFEGRSVDAFDWLQQAFESRMHAIGFLTWVDGITFGKQLGRTQQASAAGKSRWDQSLGAQDKAHVLTLWNAWQSSPSKYRGNAEFSRNAIKDCAVIEDTKTIERWCREWQLSGDQNSLPMLELPNHLTK